jgi:hypothetical protein
MNHISQYNELYKQIERYKKFIPICPNNQLINIFIEIEKIIIRCDFINKMKLSESIKEVDFYYEIKQSKINKLDF